jgi:capsular polysaccharide biosynthesis protein
VNGRGPERPAATAVRVVRGSDVVADGQLRSHWTDHPVATTQFIVSSSSVQAIIAGAAGGSDRTTLDQAKLVLSEPVADRVLRRLGLAESHGALLATVDAEPVVGSSFVTVTAERGTADQSAAVANTFVREYFAYRKAELTGEADWSSPGFVDT